jgi:hypothetical protein
MKYLKKIVLINLVILAVYMGIINLSFINDSEGELAILIVAAFGIGAQVTVNFVISLIRIILKKEDGLGFLLASIIILAIGFSSCMANVAVISS